MAQTIGKTTWPPLPYEDWRETAATLHLWLQIVGKIRLTLTPWLNHSWHVTLHTTARGLSTPPMWHQGTSFQIEFDFIDHRLIVRTDDGRVAILPLVSQTTKAFYHHVISTLEQLGLPVQITTMPNEIADAIPLDVDEAHGTYDPEFAHRYWRILAQAGRVLEYFRSNFLGKSSPVHYFWGSADLAVTRFSGREAPVHPGGIPNLPDWITREAYSHEVSSAGFWAGGEQYPRAIFYSYAYPEPMGFARASVSPSIAHYDEILREFVLPYDEVRAAASPESMLLDFLQSTYEAAANLGGWDRRALERTGASRG
ncbi:MAG: DUF5996 family protein [Gammaproteobacteria bacterium]|nr:hypothetical protein [Gammaproteobacteria bacterium]